MTLGERFKTLRQKIGLSQEAVGAQGFISTPGWVKIENNKRQASEKVIEKFIRWLVQEKYLRPESAPLLKEELLTLKYLGSNSLFLRNLAEERAKMLPNGKSLMGGAAAAPPRRGRPRRRKVGV